MGSPSIESIHDLGQQVINGCREKQSFITHDFENLRGIIGPQENKTENLQDEERQADLYQSNSTASKKRREETHAIEFQHELKLHEEIKRLFDNFLLQQIEYLVLQKEQRIKEAKEKDFLLKVYDELNQGYQKQILVNEELNRLQAEMKKYLEHLQALISHMLGSIIRDNQTFNANFVRNIRHQISSLFLIEGDNFIVHVGSREIKLNLNHMTNIFLKINDAAFENISRNENSNIDALKLIAQDEITQAIQEQIVEDAALPPVNDEDIQRATMQVKSVFETQEASLLDHLAIQQAKQATIVVCQQAEDIITNLDQHCEQIHQQVSTVDPDDEAFFNSTEDCVNECKQVMQPVNIQFIERADHYAEALKNKVCAAQIQDVEAANQAAPVPSSARSLSS